MGQDASTLQTMGHTHAYTGMSDSEIYSRWHVLQAYSDKNEPVSLRKIKQQHYTENE